MNSLEVLLKIKKHPKYNSLKLYSIIVLTDMILKCNTNENYEYLRMYETNFSYKLDIEKYGNISKGSYYRAVKELTDNGLIIEIRKGYYISDSKKACSAFKINVYNDVVEPDISEPIITESEEVQEEAAELTEEVDYLAERIKMTRQQDEGRK